MKRLLLLFTPFALASASAAEFDITKYGATPNDATDDTVAILAAFKACRDAGGGTVVVPAGTFIVSRQKSETPILEIPTKTTVRGEGDQSILKFADSVNGKNFWRMLGASQEARDIIVRDLHLDGSNSASGYVKGQTPEQNHGLFFYSKNGAIENVTIQNCLVENFCGDCVGLSHGCRKFTIRDVRVRNFVRQGIQMGGHEGDGGHLVTGCRDLEGTVQPGGSTIHVEHAEGGSGYTIEGNYCGHSLLAGGGAQHLVVRNNEIVGRVEGNSIKDGLFENNRVKASGAGKMSMMQFGFASGLVIRGNTIDGGDSDSPGIYVWGMASYNPVPSKDIQIEKNVLTVRGQPILLASVHGGTVRDNEIHGSSVPQPVVTRRCEKVEVVK